MDKVRHNTPVFRLLSKYDPEKELFKLLDEDQKICYNNLVDLCAK